MPTTATKEFPAAKVTAKTYRQTLAAILALLTAGVAYSVWTSHNGASPCPLCIFQRMLFMGLMALAVAGLALPMKAPRALLATMVAISLGGLGVAAYQCWMQEFPGSVTTCGYVDPTPVEQLVDWAGLQVPYLFLATGYCEHKDIAMLGVSWAQLSVLAFLLVFTSTSRPLSIFVLRRGCLDSLSTS